MGFYFCFLSKRKATLTRPFPLPELEVHDRQNCPSVLRYSFYSSFLPGRVSSVALLECCTDRLAEASMFASYTLFKRSTVVIVLTCTFVVSPPVRVTLAAQSQQDSPSQSVPIFVSDFELPAVASRPPSRPAPNAAKKPDTPSSGLLQDTDSPSEQARLVVD